MQLLYTLFTGGGQGGRQGGMLIPIAVDWGVTVDQVHNNHLELPEQYSVEWAKYCT